MMAIISCILSIQTIAQTSQAETHYYYIEEASYDLLKPTKLIENQDKTVSLEFKDNSITSFFEDFTIKSYFREFEFSRFKSLHKYYLIGLDNSDLVQELQTHSAIISAEYAGTIEDIIGKPLDTPNDYFVDDVISGDWIPDGTFGPNGELIVPYLQHNIRGFEHLELINARRAWNITTGDLNVVIGVRDSNFNVEHSEISNKVVATYGNVNSNGEHGLSVAGTAAGDTNNNIGFSSIGYNTSLALSTGTLVSGTNGYAGASLFMAENNSNIKVINISLGGAGTPLTAQADAFEVLKDSLNVTVVVAAGNGQQSNTPNNVYYYPASYEHVIGVSSVGSYNKYGHVYDNGASVDWKDVHEQVIGVSAYNHQHNDSIDIVAPGYNVPAPRLSNSYVVGTGTSYASPIVAGTAALMYAVNPGITAERVKEILQETADDKIYDIPENAPYIGALGAGRVNAYGAVLKAQCEYNNNPVGLDLNMQNTKEDFGDEPDVDSDVIWNSPDIWVRNQPDGFLYKESEDLHFVDSNTPVYVYVRVTNDSCHPSSGTEQLELYWAKGGLQQTWPVVWDGSSNPVSAPDGSGGSFSIGNQVGVQTLPVINTGKYEILEFQWFPEDPDSYENAGFDKPWMFCFLSRIVTPDDPMTFAEGSNAATNTRNNNNIAYHNATVINVNQTNNQGSIVVGNIGNENTINTDIEFFTNMQDDNNLWLDAEVRVELNEDLWTLWQDSGAQSDYIRVLDPTQRQIMVMSNHASLNDIEMAPNEWGIATVGVNFLIHQVDAQEEYNLHVQQLYTDTQESLGGFSFTFNRDNQRQEFDAETSSTENNDGSETFYAQNINEGAKYNWYDEDGVLVYSGSDFTVSNLVAKEYKLEVIADYDGHIDYKTVETEDKRQIEYLSPNPATTSLDIGYKIADNDNAYIMLTHSNTGISYNYVINSNNSNQLIPVDQLSQGNYIVNLIANGEILDTKNLIIN